MQKVIFVKEENRRHALVRLTIYIEQGLIDDLMEMASSCGIAARSPEKVIETLLRAITEHAKAKG